MYDLHTHTFVSDGELVASELIRRYSDYGYRGVVISDHVDASNIESSVPQLAAYCRKTQSFYDSIEILPGCELTHVPPAQMQELVDTARSLGARVVIIHGETIVEPVADGTNRAGICAGADVIAHPGLITPEDVQLAKEKGVALEITSRSGHSYSNGHVVSLGREYQATLVYSSDFHEPKNLLSFDMVLRVLRSAGLSDNEVEAVLTNTERLFHSRKT